MLDREEYVANYPRAIREIYNTTFNDKKATLIN